MLFSILIPFLFFCGLAHISNANSLELGGFVELDVCSSALSEADANEDGKIVADEYVTVVQQLGPPDFLADATTFQDLSLTLQSAFNMMACQVCPTNPRCCDGENAYISIIENESTNWDPIYLFFSCEAIGKAIEDEILSDTVALSECLPNEDGLYGEDSSNNAISIVYGYEVEASSFEDLTNDVLQGLEDVFMAALLPLLFPDECASTGTRRLRKRGGRRLVAIGLSSLPLDEILSVECKAEKIASESNACVTVLGTMTLFLDQDEDGEVAIVKEALESGMTENQFLRSSGVESLVRITWDEILLVTAEPTFAPSLLALPTPAPTGAPELSPEPPTSAPSAPTTAPTSPPVGPLDGLKDIIESFTWIHWLAGSLVLIALLLACIYCCCATNKTMMIRATLMTGTTITLNRQTFFIT